MHSRCIGLSDDEDVAEKFSEGFCCSACFMKNDGETTGTASESAPVQPTPNAEVSSFAGAPASSRPAASPGGNSSDGSFGDFDMDGAGAFDEGELWG